MYPAAICTAASEKIKSAKNGFSKGLDLDFWILKYLKEKSCLVSIKNYIKINHI